MRIRQREYCFLREICRKTVAYSGKKTCYIYDKENVAAKFTCNGRVLFQCIGKTTCTEGRVNMEKSTVARQVWLLYFNRVLEEKQLISPEKARRMHSLILRGRSGKRDETEIS